MNDTGHEWPQAVAFDDCTCAWIRRAGKLQRHRDPECERHGPFDRREHPLVDWYAARVEGQGAP